MGSLACSCRRISTGNLRRRITLFLGHAPQAAEKTPRSLERSSTRARSTASGRPAMGPSGDRGANSSAERASSTARPGSPLGPTAPSTPPPSSQRTAAAASSSSSGPPPGMPPGATARSLCARGTRRTSTRGTSPSHRAGRCGRCRTGASGGRRASRGEGARSPATAALWCLVSAPQTFHHHQRVTSSPATLPSHHRARRELAEFSLADGRLLRRFAPPEFVDGEPNAVCLTPASLGW